MRILSVHNQFRQYAGSDIVAAEDEKLFAQHGEVTSYIRNSNEIAAAGQWQKALLGMDTIYSRRTVREITDLVAKFRPDVAYVHNVFPLISPSLYHVLHRLRVPSVHVIHDFRLWCPNSRFYVDNQPCQRCQGGNYWPAVQKRCVQGKTGYSALYAGSLYVNRKLGFTDKIGGYICLTEFAKNLLLQSQIPESKIHICPNHIDTSGYTPQYGGGRYVLYLGGLYRDKGVMTIAKAFAGLPHIPLKFVGAGDAEQELRDFIQQNRLSNIELVGFKGGKEKLEYLRNSMFTIVATHCYETFGLVVLEAFASGKPVIASEIGALPFLVQPQQTGLLFRSQDAADLAAKVGWLYERPRQIESMGRAARAVVEQKYDSRLRYPSLHAIFERVISSSSLN
ncbi:MAG TPA: glycosyltransferase family 4 protein [Candidatus Sulfotelmatobacter sp.]|nr:glycosyltransferase family 4 protein [Candidatus Sulfotelmatobacter sp.]